MLYIQVVISCFIPFDTQIIFVLTFPFYLLSSLGKVTEKILLSYFYREGYLRLSLNELTLPKRGRKGTGT